MLGPLCRWYKHSGETEDAVPALKQFQLSWENQTIDIKHLKQSKADSPLFSSIAPPKGIFETYFRNYLTHLRKSLFYR
jgi:hypothetical protein